ncbi:MAG: hypothetical protein LBM95_02620 [Lactobacillales bacterium]|nr:hypothetical protein [Lactobacillales bacterium]
MIRRNIPKGTNMRGVSHSSVRRVQNWMNNLPRKILGYATPHEAFEQELHVSSAA